MASALDLALERDEAQREEERQKRFKDQVRAQFLGKYANPDANTDLEKVWVAHVWVANEEDPTTGEWTLAGFRRKRKRRKPTTMARFFAKIRRQFQLDKAAQVLLMDLGEAQRKMAQPDQSWRTRPPQFQVRKAKMEQRTPEVDRTKRKSRAKQKAYKLSKKNTAFIAIGRNSWDRKPGYLYLGPLKSETLALAKREAKKMFPVWQDMIIIPTDALSKTLRGAMVRGRKVSAGTTRIAWPEVPPTFDDVLAKYLKKNPPAENPAGIDTMLHQAWIDAGKPWLSVAWMKKQVRLQTPKRSKVVWRDKLFRCSKCKGSGKSPSTIQHASALCVPISEQENKVCAANAKAHAKKIADRRRKRSDRRTEQKVKLAKAKARKRAAKKGARTRAKQRRSPVATLKRIVAKLKVLSGRSAGKNETWSGQAKSTTRTKTGTAATTSMRSARSAKPKSPRSGKASGRSSRSTRAASASQKKSVSKTRRRA